MLTNILLGFMKRHKKLLLLMTFFLGSFFLFGESAFAAEGDPSPVIGKETTDKIVSVINGFITAIAAIMGMLTSFITIFLYPGWTNGTMFGLQDYLKIIWILVSNVVYVIFAFILIAIAFMNIVNKGEGHWELKQAMPKFIIGVLIVPFSWFFVQFVLSVSAILTVSILTLPYEAFESEELFQKALANESLANEKICKDVIIILTGDEDGAKKGEAISDSGNKVLTENIRCAEGGKVSVEEILTGKGGGDGLKNTVFGVISIYTYGILKIQELDTIGKGDIGSLPAIADLIFKILFDLLFIVVYVILMVALFLALMVRGIRLWIYMMLSPVFGLLYFFGKGKEGVGGDDKFSITEFIALALVPVYVSAALAFGLVFILVASEGIKEQAGDGDGNKLEVAGFSLEIIGAHGDGESEKSIIAKLIVELFGVVILWIAVMAALGTSKVTKSIVAPIHDFGKSMGQLAAKAPTYAPIIPTGSGFMSAEGLKTIGSSATQAASAKGRSYGESFMKNKGMFGHSAEANSAGAALKQAIASGVGQPEQIRKLKEAIIAAGSISNIKNNDDILGGMKDIAEDLGVNTKYIDVELNGNAQATSDLLLEIDHHMKGKSADIESIDLLEGLDERAGNAGETRVNESLKPSPGNEGSGETTNNVSVNVSPTNSNMHTFSRGEIKEEVDISKVFNTDNTVNTGALGDLGNVLKNQDITFTQAHTSLAKDGPFSDIQANDILKALGVTK